MGVHFALKNIQEDLGLSFANKLKKKHVDWTKHKMKVDLAGQTLSASVATAIDFLRDEVCLPQFQGSEATATFIRAIDDAFDALNSRNLHAKGSKSSVTATTLPDVITCCKKLQNYIFDLRDEKGRYLWNSRRKTAIWGFSFTLDSVMSLCQDLLTQRHLQFQYILIYKFSQNSIELLINKIHQHCGSNNNPNSLEFKWALRKIIIRNSIEPSKTGNYTNFDESLCDPKNFISFSREHLGVGSSITSDIGHEQFLSLEEMLDQVNQVYTNPLQDNILYYISGYVVQSILKEESCEECKTELLDDYSPTDANTQYSKFQKLKNRGGLTHASPSVFKIVKAAEREFQVQVAEHQERITFDKNIDLKIQSGVLETLGVDMFIVSSQHYFDYRIGQETDHLSSLLRRVV